MKKYRLLCLLLAALAVLLLLASCGGEDAAPVTTAAPGSEGTPAETETPTDLASYFVLEKEEYEGTEYYVVAGVSEEGKKQKKLTVPENYEGLEVLAANPQCFSGCDKLEEVTFRSNVREFYNDLFPGCTSLRKIRLDFGPLVKAITEDPSVAETLVCSTAADGSLCGQNSMIEGLDESKIKFVFTDQDAYDYFCAEYTWGVFASIMTLEK